MTDFPLTARLGVARRALGRTFGAWGGPVMTGLGLGLVRGACILGRALDPVFFPALRRTVVREPVVIAGLPRSGTTFLQRFLTDHGIGVGSELWTQLFPSLVVQSLLRPFLPALERLNPARFHASAAHEVRLDGAEVDDAALLFRYTDGFLFYALALAWAEEDVREAMDPRFRDTSARDFAFFEAMWRRNLVRSGRRRVLAKMFSLGVRIQPFFRHFPDARVLWMERDPLDVVPSTLSLLSGALEGRFGYWRLPEEVRQRWVDRMVAGLRELLLRFHEERQAGRLPADRVLVVPFGRLMGDLEAMMAEILAFIGHEPDEALRRAIAERAEKQKRWKSGHTYDLARFGLDEARIRRDFAFFYGD